MRTMTILAMTIALVGCARRSDGTASRSTGGELASLESCPLYVPQTDVVVEDTEDGSRVVFTTRSDVEDLRARVASGAARHGAMNHEEESLTDIPASVTVENVEGGAQMSIVPQDPRERDALRRDVAERIAKMRASGTCSPG